VSAPRSPSLCSGSLRRYSLRRGAFTLSLPNVPTRRASAHFLQPQFLGASLLYNTTKRIGQNGGNWPIPDSKLPVPPQFWSSPSQTEERSQTRIFSGGSRRLFFFHPKSNTLLLYKSTRVED